MRLAEPQYNIDLYNQIIHAYQSDRKEKIMDLIKQFYSDEKDFLPGFFDNQRSKLIIEKEMLALLNAFERNGYRNIAEYIVTHQMDSHDSLNRTANP